MRRTSLRYPALIAAVLLLDACALVSRASGAKVESGALDELSGLVVSLADPAVIWAHNDSGDAPRLFRMSLTGKDLGHVRIEGAAAEDWEDIAAFAWQGRPALLVGDIGDNRATRDHVTLYAVSDPGAHGDPVLLWTLAVRYPDGPRDAEALAVDPVDHDILLISKREHPQQIYRIAVPAMAPPRGTVVTAERLGALTTLPRSSYADFMTSPLYTQLDGPTALDIAHSGRFAVITTYKDAFLYRRAPGQSWIEAFAAAPQVVKLPALEQAEAGGISADDRALFVSGEGEHPPLARVALPSTP